MKKFQVSEKSMTLDLRIPKKRRFKENYGTFIFLHIKKNDLSRNA